MSGLGRYLEGTETIFGDYTVHAGAGVRGINHVADFYYDYWCALSADGHLPTRSDVTLPAIARHADRLVLMDVVREGGEFRLIVRLIATFVATYYGELAGRDIRSMPNVQAAERIYRLAGLVLETGKPQLSVTPAFAPERRYKEAIALYLPLYDEAGAISKIMVAVDVLPLGQAGA